jgi:heavy metal sensor kinase
MTPLSLKWRVSLWVSVVLVAAITTVSVVAYVEFQESHLRQIDRTLLAMANGIVASLDERQNGKKLEEEVRAVTTMSSPNTSSFSYRVWMKGSSDDLLASDAPGSERGRWLHEIPDQDGPPREEFSFVDIGRSGNEYRAIWMRHKINEQIANVVVAGSSHFTFHELREFLRLLLILGGSLIAVSIVATMWTVRCGLRPIDATAEQLQSITHPNIGKAIFDQTKAPKELRPFVRALTDMLGRLNSVLQQQKQFTSDAAHELRTPLASAKSTLQAAQRQERRPEEYRRAIDEALEDAARMERLIGQLLVLARMDEVHGRAATANIELDVLLGELAETYDEKARPSGGKVVFEKSSATTVQGNLDELARLFSNVLDNAVRYGPPGGTIRVVLERGPDGYTTVRIHDEGGKIPPEELPHLFDRFYRVDHSRSSSTGGAGLGLAIAREIVHRHHGDISITSGPALGTLVSIRLARTSGEKST